MVLVVVVVDLTLNFFCVSCFNRTKKKREEKNTLLGRGFFFFFFLLNESFLSGNDQMTVRKNDGFSFSDGFFLLCLF